MHPRALFDTNLIYRYLAYRIRAGHRNGKGVQSFFAGRFIRQVFFGDPIPGLEIVEQIRQTMLSDRNRIRAGDHGAGSRRGMYDLRSLRDLVRFTSIPEKYGHILARTVRLVRPGSILELGTGTGLSTLYMSLADPGTRILTCEGSEPVADIARLNLRKAGASNVKIITGQFQDDLPGMLNQMDDEMLLFLDGDHREESIVSIFRQIMDHPRHFTGILVFDDINWSAAMKRGWDRIRSDPRVAFSMETFRMGFAFLGRQVTGAQYIIDF